MSRVHGLGSELGERLREKLSITGQPTKGGGARARPQRNDGSLLAAIRAGDPQAASDLCDRLWPHVDRTVKRLLGRFDSAREDLAQTSLIEIVKTIGNYRGECSLDRWAQIITAHAVFKHIRRRDLERRVLSGLVADDLYAGPVEVEQMWETRQLLERVFGHLEKINAKRVWAFLLHDVMGFDLLEIAEMTGTGVATAQCRLWRGRRELHERVGRDSELSDLLPGFPPSASPKPDRS